jgi:hypothetical protein
MKKLHVDHVLRAAGEITGERQFIIVGSQALHGKFPDVPQVVHVRRDRPRRQAERDRARWLERDRPRLARSTNPSATTPDPVDETTAKLPKGWKSRLVALPDGDTGGVRGPLPRSRTTSRSPNTSPGARRTCSSRRSSRAAAIPRAGAFSSS